MNSNNKVQVKVYLPEDTINKIRKEISKRGDYRKGSLSDFIEKAALSFLAAGSVQRHAARDYTDPTQRANAFMLELLNFLEREEILLAGEGHHTIQEQHLNHAIGQLRSTDSRTIKKWTNLLKDNHIIRAIGVKLYEISQLEDPSEEVVKLNDDRERLRNMTQQDRIASALQKYGKENPTQKTEPEQQPKKQELTKEEQEIFNLYK